MALGRYDALYGGKPGAASKALAAMRETYGDVKGEQVFYGRARVVAAERRGGLVAGVRSRSSRK